MLLTIIEEDQAIWQEQVARIEEAKNLQELLAVSWELTSQLTVRIIEKTLVDRAEQATEWRCCEGCGKRLESKGMRPRQITTIFGPVHWKRRVGRCPAGCRIGQVVPLDEELGLEAYQGSDQGLKQKACLLAVFVPFETAAMLLKQLTGSRVSATSIWTWVQAVGKQLEARLETELQQMEQGIVPAAEELDSPIDQQPLLIGADGVMVPFRPNGGQPKGNIRYREVKVGILSRLTSRFNRSGVLVSELKQRRLVAMVGPIADFAPCLRLEALRQGIEQAECVVWLSDGAAGLWCLFEAHFAAHALGVLDFYHATQNLWQGVGAWMGGRSRAARSWFHDARHRLRHEQADDVLADLLSAAELPELSAASQATIARVYAYLDKHRDHIQYHHLKEAGLPIGSGLVESACKWLIQQRFKGVGMRWGEQSFTHLLLLRLAWVNGRFEACFCSSPNF